MRRSSRAIVPTTVATVVLLPIATNVATGQWPGSFARYLWLAWPISIILAVVVVAAETRQARDQDGTAHDPELLERAVHALAETTRLQWRAEAALRTLNQPTPIRVGWSLSLRPVSAAMDSVMAATGRRPPYASIAHSGDLDDVVDVFQRLPHRQLVVLGEPGAGKSVAALAVTLRLLAVRGASDPVPVLLSLSSWDPTAEHLTTWVARRLVEDHPALGTATSFGFAAAQRLVDSGRVVLVLDGLDEIPEASHVAAITTINDLSATGSSFVLTCRTTEYEQAVSSGGQALATAFVIELHPVRGADAIDYLSRSGPGSPARWAAVAARLNSHPDGPLGMVFAMPLMVWLARTIYARPGSDPTELLDTVRFPDREMIENHLLDRLIPSVYPTRPAPSGARPASTYPPESARRWLVFLSRQLSEQQTTDIAWWKLHECASVRYRSVAGAVTAAAIGTFFVLSLLATSGWSTFTRLGLLLWPIFIPLVGFAIAARGTPTAPGRIAVQVGTDLRRTLHHVRMGLVIGAGASVPFLLDRQPSVGLVMLVIGVAVSLFMGLLHRPDVVRAASPTGLLRADRQTLIALGFLGAAAGGIGAWSVVILVGSMPTWLVGLPAGGFTGGLAATLRLRRWGVAAGIASGGLVGSGVGVIVGGQVTGLVVVTTSGVVFGAGYGLVTGMKHLASPWYGLSSTWLALRGHLPWRLMPFLADAHDRGVLRQMGGVYQFRHLRLRDHLAARSSRHGSNQ